MFNLGNEVWSGNKKQGDEIAFSLLGDYTSDSSEPIMLEEVSLNGEVMCREMNTEESWSLTMLFIVLGPQQNIKYMHIEKKWLCLDSEGCTMTTRTEIIFILMWFHVQIKKRPSLSISVSGKWRKFTFKICHTVAGLSIVSQFQRYFFQINFWRFFCHLVQLWGRAPSCFDSLV